VFAEKSGNSQYSTLPTYLLLLKTKHQFQTPAISFQSNSANMQFILLSVALGGLVVIMLAIGSKIHWFKPVRGQLIFKGDKNP
jgi:hypothetical protein